MHDRIRDMALSRWGRFVATRPILTLIVCLTLAAVSVVFTVRELEFRPDRSDLIDPDLSWNRRYADYKAQFTRWNDLIVCIDGDPGDPETDAIARRIADDLRESPRIRAADAGFEARETGPRLFSVAPDGVFEDVLEQIRTARTIAAAPDAGSGLGVLLAQLRGRDETDPGAGTNAPGGMAELEELERVLAPYLAALTGDEPDFGFLRPDEPHWLPLVSATGSGRIRFVQVQFESASGAIDAVSENLTWLRERIAASLAAIGAADVTWGVTGIPAIEADETTQSIHDSTLASIVALVLITGLMLVVFRGVIVPLLAAASLLVGMAWSFGWLILSVGHLQLLSVVFSVILLGLGVDFALHLVARLELVRDEHPDLPSALARVYRGIGPGMLTGAVTTAAAFGATALTKFSGMAEMGVIAGGGILLCLVAMLSMFPATLALTRRWKRIIRHRPGGETAHFAHGRLDVIDYNPWRTLLVGGLILVLLLIPASRVRYDPNVLNLHPPGIESVEWERKIVEEDASSVWSAIVRATPEDAPRLARTLRALPVVSKVGAMGLLLRDDRDERAARIAAVRDAPAPRLAPAPGLASVRRQLAAARLGLARRAEGAPPDLAPRLQAIAASIGDALAGSARLDAAAAAARAARLDEAWSAATVILRAWLDDALDPTPPGPDDLPPVLRARWTDGDTWLLRVEPAPDPKGRSILHPDRLPVFIRSVAQVAPGVLGPPVQIYESTELIKREYTKAAIYAVIAIVLLLLMDFRSIGDTACAMIPVGIGFLGVFGLLSLFDEPLNFANIIVMPLIFGIGVDAGVHMVHRWRAEPYGRPAGLSGGTGRGVTLTMLTTMIGFGSMLIARHRGIQSLGFVMVAGLGVTLLACYTLLPAVLRLRTPGSGSDRA